MQNTKLGILETNCTKLFIVFFIHFHFDHLFFVVTHLYTRQRHFWNYFRQFNIAVNGGGVGVVISFFFVVCVTLWPFYSTDRSATVN